MHMARPLGGLPANEGAGRRDATKRATWVALAAKGAAPAGSGSEHVSREQLDCSQQGAESKPPVSGSGFGCRSTRFGCGSTCSSSNQ
ncbi:hypothetical protein C2845_PM14G08850 [Panicum miliaceum]|uniref:Uncharacterized protein n=1 Tax=Panicum miliaceum TaxID=4540 RepID=A0A3L6PTV2_PANMI|nr:hypothetical protein C2845_PM14G08850 [Panicum miliaceum]